jgi:pyrroloquinoline-quinone synthase
MMNPSATGFLEPLLNELESHPVNSNAFFQAFKDRWLSRDQLQVFLRQYHYFCKHFVKELEGLLYHTPLNEVELRVELIKTLHSELGDGDGERAHIRLLERFARAAGLSKTDLEGTVPISEVTAYLSLLHRLFTESNYLAALGAELAVETTAAAEFRYFYPGLTKYADFRAGDLAFFQLHLQAEECHSQWLADAVRKTAKTQADLDEVAAGARATADAWQMFWEGMYREVFEKANTGVLG